ncbi:MAG: RsmB/NOP family class I SAM-dependent RNA methyltransferase, partial [Pseudomonadota bacterium]
DAKWRLTEADLERYIKIQSEILEKASEFVSEAGLLCYATCSIFTDENEAQLSRFQAANPCWIVTAQARADIATRGDGFFSASLRRS